MKLSTCLNQFFVQYLPRIKGSSEQTIHAYRDAYRLFLPFAAEYHHIKIASLRIQHLSVELIIAFLNHLEEDRKNSARTRNLRLVAIKSLAKMLRFMYPQHRQLAQQILNIPQKRMQKKLIGYLYPEEIMDVYNVNIIYTCIGLMLAAELIKFLVTKYSQAGLQRVVVTKRRYTKEVVFAIMIVLAIYMGSFLRPEMHRVDQLKKANPADVKLKVQFDRFHSKFTWIYSVKSGILQQTM